MGSLSGSLPWHRSLKFFSLRSHNWNPVLKDRDGALGDMKKVLRQQSKKVLIIKAGLCWPGILMLTTKLHTDDIMCGPR